MTDFLLCGWRVRSDIHLPELPRWPGDSRPPDVEIVVESVPPHLGDATPVPLMADAPVPPPLSIAVSPDGTTLLDVAGVARFLARGGRRVSVDPSVPKDDPAVRLYLLGSMLATLSYQRGFIPLHACCLMLPQDSPTPFPAGAVAISGDSGAGKSTLAATLTLQGIPILADDICVVDPSTPGGPVVWPSVARLKLWRDTVERLGLPIGSLECVREGIDKYAMHDVPMFHTEPTRLSAVYHLTRRAGAGGAPPPDRVEGFAAVKLLHRCLYRPQIASAMGLDAALVRGGMALLGTTPLFQLSHDPADPAALPLAERLAEHWNTLAPIPV